MKMTYEEPLIIRINDRTYGTSCSNGSGDNCMIGCSNGDTPDAFYVGFGFIPTGCGTGTNPGS